MTVPTGPNPQVLDELPPQIVHPLREVPHPANLEPFYSHYESGVPIAIDLGTSLVRAGLTNSDVPNNVFPSLVAKYRDRKLLKSLTLIGNDVYRDPSSKSSIKAPFDGPLITNWDYIESILDYSFEHLSVTSDNGKVNNPIIMTEPIGVPFQQRKNMYELLFEAYQAPSVTFGIDHLFSFYANTPGFGSSTNGLVIGSGGELTHVIPVISGKGIMLQTKRIDWGGNPSQQFLQRLIALKYPYFPSKITNTHTTYLFQDHCYILESYQEELGSFLSMDSLDKTDVVVQAAVDVSVSQEKKKSEEELARQAAKRREQGKRLQEQAQQKRLEKLAQKEQEFEYFTNVRKEFESMSEANIQRRLENEDFLDMNDFNKYMVNLEKTIKKGRHEDIPDGDEDVDPETAWKLVDIPDDQLTEDEVKEKRKQRLMKANHEARQRAKEAKKEEEELKAQYDREQQEWRDRDLNDWCDVKRQELAQIIGRIKERESLLDSFKDRKSAAAQQRMKNIADLANDENGSTNPNARKRRRNANASIDNDPNDTFGANDDDWNAYRDITNVSLEEEQDVDNQAVLKLEEELLKFDPNFHHEDTLAASQTFDWKNLVLHKFIHGPRQNVTIAMQAEGHDAEEIANHPEIIKRNHQIHLNVERIRVPEVLFQPGIAGLDQAGIAELLDDLVHRRLDGDFSPSGQSHNVIKDVFICGGLSVLPNFTARIKNDFTSFLPVGFPFKVRKARDPTLDPWKGMKLWSQSESFKNSLVSQAEYEEMGPEYIKEHGLGNVCLRGSQ